MTTTTRAPEEDARHLHTPGQLSRAGVLDVGLKCAHSCRFCYYSYIDGSDDQFRGIRHGGLRRFENCQAILAGFARQGFTHFDVTGGEPTLLPRLPELVAHAADEADFKAFTGGSWRALESAMDALDARGFQFGTNTTVFADNYRKLPDIAAALCRHGVYVQNYIFFNAYHGWRQSERAARVQARYSDAYPHLRQAVDLLTGQGVAVNIRYVPLCVVPGLERHVVGVLGLAHDPFEWRNRACNYEAAPEFCAEALEIPASGVRDCHAFHPADERLENGVRVTGMRGDRFKLFASACADCAARDACDGVDPGYLARYGDAELRPYADMALSGVLLKDRLDYAPAFALKLGGRAVMRPGAPGAERRS
jgi:pyrroloquinoline quinone biosynthesis protein E